MHQKLFTFRNCFCSSHYDFYSKLKQQPSSGFLNALTNWAVGGKKKEMRRVVTSVTMQTVATFAQFRINLWRDLGESTLESSDSTVRCRLIFAWWRRRMYTKQTNKETKNRNSRNCLKLFKVGVSNLITCHNSLLARVFIPKLFVWHSSSEIVDMKSPRLRNNAHYQKSAQF